jgi:hypothetical protein
MGVSQRVRRPAISHEVPVKCAINRELFGRREALSGIPMSYAASPSAPFDPQQGGLLLANMRSACAYKPSPLPGRFDGACSLVYLRRPRLSVYNSEVGSCNCSFEAGSPFTHVMA